MAFDSGTGVVSGTPTLAAAGTSDLLHVTATDSLGAQGTTMLTLSVAQPLAFATASLPGSEVGVPYSVALQASGGSGPYAWSVANGPLPSGLGLDPSTGVISGTPTQAGGDFSQIELCATDTTGAVACNDHSLGLTVAGAVEITTTSLPGAAAGSAYSVTLQAASGSPAAGGYVWSVPESATSSGYPLPPWLSLSSGGTLSGTPPASAGTASFTIPVQVSDSLGGVASASLSLVLTGASLPDLTVTTATAPSSAAAGSSINVSWTVKNIAASAPASGSWEDSVYIEVNPTALPTLLGSFPESVHSPLAPGGSYTDTESVMVPADTTAASYYLTVMTDSGQTIAESSYANNSSSMPLAVSAASGGTAGTVTEYPVPTGSSQPDGITAGPDGNLWFIERLGNKIGKITPSGTITEYPVTTANAGSYDITAGPDGNLWFTEADANQIGRITTSGTITEYALAAGTEPGGIAAGPDGNLWFTEYGTDKIGKITPSGAITEYAIPTASALPYDITAGLDGKLWFTELGTDKIGVITTSGSITEYPVTTVGSQPTGITAGPDGKLWFTDSGANEIGVITTSGTVTEYPVPTANASPANIAVGPDGSLWFTEKSVNQIGSITTSGTVTEYPVPTASSQPYDIAAGPDGNLWFTELVGNKIGKIVPGAALPTLRAAATSPKTQDAIAVGDAPR